MTSTSSQTPSVTTLIVCSYKHSPHVHAAQYHCMPCRQSFCAELEARMIVPVVIHQIMNVHESDCKTHSLCVFCFLILPGILMQTLARTLCMQIQSIVCIYAGSSSSAAAPSCQWFAQSSSTRSCQSSVLILLAVLTCYFSNFYVFS
jgi:hypothetical protein